MQKQRVERHLEALNTSCQDLKGRKPWPETYAKICGRYGKEGFIKGTASEYHRTALSVQDVIRAKYAALGDFDTLSATCRQTKRTAQKRADEAVAMLRNSKAYPFDRLIQEIQRMDLKPVYHGIRMLQDIRADHGTRECEMVPASWEKAPFAFLRGLGSNNPALRPLRQLCYRIQEKKDPKAVAELEDFFRKRWQDRVPPSFRRTLSSDPEERIHEMFTFSSIAMGLDEFSRRAGDTLDEERLRREVLDALDPSDPLGVPGLRDLDRDYVAWAEGLNPGLCKKDRGHSDCSCLGEQYAKELRTALTEGSRANWDREVVPLVKGVEQVLHGSIEKMKLSSSTRDRLSAYLKAHPIAVEISGGGLGGSVAPRPYRLNLDGKLVEDQFNASYDPNLDHMTFSPVAIDLLRQRPQEGRELLEATVSHELGHRLEMLLTARSGNCGTARLNPPCPAGVAEIARGLTAEDVQVLRGVAQCMDRNTQEVEDVLNRGSQAVSPGEDVRAAKRVESFGDLVRKRYLRVRSEKLASLPERASFLYRSLGDNCQPPVGSSLYLKDGHENPQTRIATTLAGLAPLTGESLGLSEPRQCDLELFK